MQAKLTRISYYVYNANLLVEAREARKLGQQEVADATGLDRATVWRVETGRAASYESVEALCVYLNLIPSDVIKPADNQQEKRGKHRKKISANVA